MSAAGKAGKASKAAAKKPRPPPRRVVALVPGKKHQRVVLPGAAPGAPEGSRHVDVYQNVFSPETLRDMNLGAKRLPWERLTFQAWGRECKRGCKSVCAFYGDRVTYTYASSTQEPIAAEPWMRAMRAEACAVAGVPEDAANFALLNRYAPEDSLAQHRDSEGDMAVDRVVSVSFGDAARAMDFDALDGSGRIRLTLPPNSVVHWEGADDVCTHGIPRQRRAAGVRYNATLRLIRNL